MKQSHKLNATSSTQHSRNKMKNTHRTATALDAQGCVLNLEFETQWKKKKKKRKKKKANARAATFWI